ncbi:MAG: zinc ribbon domain-containing protein [Desulfurococcaceae archaeon]
MRKLREVDVKKDLRNKVALVVAKVAKEERAVVVLEKFPKRFQDRALDRNRLKSLDAHRLKQSAIRGIQKQIVEKALEHGVRVELVDPRNTSRKCPLCGSSLAPVTGNAQRRGWSSRLVKYGKCGFTHDRDVIGAWNIALKLDVSPVPLGSKGAHDPCVKWLVVIVNCGAGGTTRPRKTYKNLGRETVFECSRCGFKLDKQKLASLNIYFKYSRMWGFPTAVNPNKMEGSCELGLP